MACLNKHLLNTWLSLIKQSVDLLHVGNIEAMSDHIQGLDCAGLDKLEEMIPVLVDGRLTVTDQADAGLHERANIEMVALSCISLRA